MYPWIRVLLLQFIEVHCGELWNTACGEKKDDELRLTSDIDILSSVKNSRWIQQHIEIYTKSRWIQEHIDFKNLGWIQELKMESITW